MKLSVTVVWVFLTIFTLTSCAVEKTPSTVQAQPAVITPDLKTAMGDVVFRIPVITASADMVSRHNDQVKILRELRLTLLTIKAKGILLDSERVDLSHHLTISVVPELQRIVADNKKMIAMGQLDKRRVIEPTVAMAENNRLNDLIEKIKYLILQLK